MLKDVVSKLDYSFFDEIALLLLAMTFMVIVFGAMKLSKEAALRFSSIPLKDDIQDPFISTSSNKSHRPGDDQP